MTWSLQIHDGDLVIGGGSLAVVANENKLVQDFRHYLLTRMGSDPMHRYYGSVLDGGVDGDGEEYPSMIGTYDWRVTFSQVESEIRRIALDYQSQQIDRAKSDSLRYNKTTLTVGEILASIERVEFHQDGDVLKVDIQIRTGSNNLFPVNVRLT